MRVLALYYFAGLLDRFIRVQVGGAQGKQLKNIRNCAWDIWLSTLPEQLLASSEEPTATTYFFGTRERGLAEFVLAEATRAVIVEHSGKHFPIRDIDENRLVRSLGVTALEHLEEMRQRTEQHQRDRIVRRVVPVNLPAALPIIADIETAFLKKMCRATSDRD
jgi:hypothetical protein